ncbi:putative thiol oxidase [Dioscorea sansibarensis]
MNPIQKPVAAPLTKEEFGRATWTLLHTIAAQFPDNPTRQQKHDVKEMQILCRPDHRQSFLSGCVIDASPYIAPWCMPHNRHQAAHIVGSTPQKTGLIGRVAQLIYARGL